MRQVTQSKKARIGALWLASLLLLAACGAPEPSKQTQLQRLRTELKRAFQGFGAADVQDAFVARLSPPKQRWHTMTRDQKRRHMEQHVMPVMLAFYDLYRPPREKILRDRGQALAHFSKPTQSEEIPRLPRTLDCKTCHGGGPADQFEPDFSKPTTLFPLDPNNMPTEHDPDPFIASTVKYMKEIVTPAMAMMLDRPDFNCFGCHAKK